jgi:hypothetical protein
MQQEHRYEESEMDYPILHSILDKLVYMQGTDNYIGRRK